MLWDAPALPIATEGEALNCSEPPPHRHDQGRRSGTNRLGHLHRRPHPSSWRISGSSDTEVPRQFAACFYAYPVFLYLNFSGYTDVVVAAARLVGTELPENPTSPTPQNVIDFLESLAHSV